MKKRIGITIVGLVVLVGVLGGIKALQIQKMIAAGASFTMPPETVTAAEAKKESWASLLTSVGTLEAVNGVTLTAELSGKVVDVAFESGGYAEKGTILLRQDVASELAGLRAAESAASLAKINLERMTSLVADSAVSQLDFDNQKAEYDQAAAQVDNLRAIIGRKTIRAPFSGRLGIRKVNVGQVVADGNEIVSLQSLDPIYVNFWLPQQDLGNVRKGLVVHVTSDAAPDKIIEGKITAISSMVDPATRNFEVQATIANTKEKLRPGMFVNVAVVMDESDDVVIVPVTAVLYAPYGDQVFVVEDDSTHTGKVVRQEFVRLGRQRGDYVAITHGLKEGETVVSTGVFKLRNGMAVVVDNKLSPEFSADPNPDDE